MNIIIVGAGKSGTYLAEKLREKHRITVVELDTSHVECMQSQMPDVRVIRGDGCEPSVLDRAGVAEADLVAALTGDDEDNLVVSFLSKHTHRVPMVFARTNHPHNEWMFTKTWGVDVAVSTVSMIFDLVEHEMGIGRLITLMGLKSEDVVIDEIALTGGMRATDKAIKNLGLPPRTHIMAIVSNANVVVPTGDTVLKAGDEVLILSHRGEEDALRAVLGEEA
jgi:trk system potassium uptake protein TrkA